LVIGGSLGGLFAANLVARAGWDVEVFEHSREELAGRGAGIVPHPEQFEALARIGVPIDDSFGVDIPLRATFDRGGQLIASLVLKQVFTTWGRLYQLLRGALPDRRYHLGHSL
jgi:2-polyprenyl-6-methoxyphenol hydroxylase-like FAD-dependent oxidoreductase